MTTTGMRRISTGLRDSRVALTKEANDTGN
jgi:hypothetical protein